MPRFIIYECNLRNGSLFVITFAVPNAVTDACLPAQSRWTRLVATEVQIKMNSFRDESPQGRDESKKKFHYEAEQMK